MIPYYLRRRTDVKILVDIGWDMTNHRKRGAPSGSVPFSRPRQRSRPPSRGKSPEDGSSSCHHARSELSSHIGRRSSLASIYPRAERVLRKREARERERIEESRRILCSFPVVQQYTLSAMKRYITFLWCSSCCCCCCCFSHSAY